MKRVYQTKFGHPEGNCFNACVASILECSLEDLPDLEKFEAKGVNWLDGLNEALRPMGYGVIHVPASEENPASVYIPPRGHFIASGDGYGALLHSVVCEERGRGDVDIVHDPYPEAKKRGFGLKKVLSMQFVIKV